MKYFFIITGDAQDDRISYNLIDTNSNFTRSGSNLYKKNAAKFNKNFSKYVSKYEDALATDEIFKELVIKPTGYYLSKLPNATSAAVSKGPKLPDPNFSKISSNPNLLMDDSFEAEVQQSVQSIRPSAPPMQQVTHSIHHHHHVLYKACSSG